MTSETQEYSKLLVISSTNDCHSASSQPKKKKKNRKENKQIPLKLLLQVVDNLGNQ